METVDITKSLFRNQKSSILYGQCRFKIGDYDIRNRMLSHHMWWCRNADANLQNKRVVNSGSSASVDPRQSLALESHESPTHFAFQINRWINGRSEHRGNISGCTIEYVTSGEYGSKFRLLPSLLCRSAEYVELRNLRRSPLSLALESRMDFFSSPLLLG